MALLQAGTACFRNTPRQEAAMAGSSREPQVLGHAGSGFFTPLSPFNPWPPSSLGGILHALQLGADGVEVDVQLSQDSVPMLYHDVRLDNISTGTGCVSQYPAAQLVQLRYRGGRPYDWFQQERPITLDTLLVRLRRRPTLPVLHIDLHERDHCAAPGHEYDRVPALARQLARRFRSWPPERLLILSMEVNTLRQLRALLPQATLGLEITADDFDSHLRTAITEKVQAVVLDADKVTPAQAAQARAAGLQVVVFGGRSTGDIKRLLECRPDAIEVDNVGRLRAILKNRRS
ncbi:glycerophosphodiester phosphodiesterase [Hymenobacter saemangeumensis]|uniref:Glycerophosphodiester phosphodiesterase n=1 Tax=Hymenobacter saemangeumensis TaxID=1084522 RepID=A0ABP8IU33_9BACT